LERIAVDEHNRSVRTDEQTALIHISKDVAVPMHDREGTRDVGRSVDEEAEVDLWKRFTPAFRAV
jgi:hypothetical protein